VLQSVPLDWLSGAVSGVAAASIWVGWSVLTRHGAPVYTAANNDLYLLILAETANAVHDAMVPRDAPRPPAAQIAAKRLGSADALERVSPNVAQENVHPAGDIRISFLPI